MNVIYVHGNGDLGAKVVVLQEKPTPNVNVVSIIRDICGIDLDIFSTNIIRIELDRPATKLELFSWRTLSLNDIERINPKLVILMGQGPTDIFLGFEHKIDKVRGKIFNVNFRKIMPVYDVSLVLKNKKKFAIFKKDIKKIVKEIKWKTI